MRLKSVQIDTQSHVNGLSQKLVAGEKIHVTSCMILFFVMMAEKVHQKVIKWRYSDVQDVNMNGMTGIVLNNTWYKAWNYISALIAQIG